MPESNLKHEIFQQPNVLAQMFDRERENVARIVAELKRHEIDYLTVAARGTSDNAGVYGKYLFSVMAGLPTVQATPSLHTLYRQPPKFKHTAVIAISQSGESTDILAVMEDGKKQGVPTIGITNRPDSTMAKTADHVILLGAGEEKSIAATKTYTTSLAAMAMLAVEWCGADDHRAEMDALTDKVAAVLRNEAQTEEVAQTLIYLEDCAVIGRGFNYATAFEAALKLKELSYVRAEPYSSADFIHGPIAILQPNYCVVEIAPSGGIFENMLEFAQRVKASGGRLIAISDQLELLQMAAGRLELPTGVPEWLSPLVAVVPAQLLALHLTEAKGYEADHPRGLTKVTRTL